MIFLGCKVQAVLRFVGHDTSDTEFRAFSGSLVLIPRQGQVPCRGEDLGSCLARVRVRDDVRSQAVSIQGQKQLSTVLSTSTPEG